MKANSSRLILMSGLLAWASVSLSGDDDRLSTHGSWTEDERAVWQVVEAWNDAFGRNDSERYFQYIARDITVLTPSNPYRVEGIHDDRAELEHGIRTGTGKVGFFQELLPRVRVYGDVAVVTFFSRGAYGPDEAAPLTYLKETDVLRRQDGVWQIVHIHVSR